MSDDLEKSLDQLFAQQQAIQEAKQIQQQEKAQRRVEEAQEAARNAEYNRRKLAYTFLLGEHQQKYHCHIRGCKYVSIPNQNVYGTVDWHTPVGVKQCKICKEWACTNTEKQPIHYLEKHGICSACVKHFERTGRLPMTKQQKDIVKARVFKGVGIGACCLLLILLIPVIVAHWNIIVVVIQATILLGAIGLIIAMMEA